MLISLPFAFAVNVAVIEVDVVLVEILTAEGALAGTVTSSVNSPLYVVPFAIALTVNVTP